ncbi:hypothetical protein SUDANB105_06997 [Streptomyces sp. enrichment culture]|uniref:hypothetical protein n=1 Tax=Streptomyces sp. enrichment culture TaxID=1795815 RepID=UPI003F549AAF
MTAEDIGPAALAVSVVLVLLVIRTAVAELKAPGSARREWAFLRDVRALATGLTALTVFAVLGWAISGPASLPWAALVGLLVARIEHSTK